MKFGLKLDEQYLFLQSEDAQNVLFCFGLVGCFWSCYMFASGTVSISCNKYRCSKKLEYREGYTFKYAHHLLKEAHSPLLL